MQSRCLYQKSSIYFSFTTSRYLTKLYRLVVIARWTSTNSAICCFLFNENQKFPPAKLRKVSRYSDTHSVVPLTSSCTTLLILHNPDLKRKKFWYRATEKFSFWTGRARVICISGEEEKFHAMNYHSKACYINVDGSQQSAFGLPHFTTFTLDWLRHSMNVFLVRVLEYYAVE